MTAKDLESFVDLLLSRVNADKLDLGTLHDKADEIVKDSELNPPRPSHGFRCDQVISKEMIKISSDSGFVEHLFTSYPKSIDL